MAAQLRAGIGREVDSTASFDSEDMRFLCGRLESLQNRLYRCTERTNVDHLGRPLNGPGPFVKAGYSPTLLDVCSGMPPYPAHILPVVSACLSAWPPARLPNPPAYQHAY